MSYKKSPLKWAGSKLALLPELLPLIGSPEHYVEPFAGSGVVAMNVDFKRATINDSNRVVAEFIEAVKSDYKSFARECEIMFSGKNNEDDFYSIRSKFNQGKTALLLYYLNRHCYNGLWRETVFGQFNTPFGRYDVVTVDHEKFHDMAASLFTANITSVDFAECMLSAPEGSVIYCDPPYLPVSKTSSFTSYSSGGFSVNRQKELAELSEFLSKERNCKVIVSNAYCIKAFEIFGKGEISVVETTRRIGASTTSRGKVKEIISVYGG